WFSWFERFATACSLASSASRADGCRSSRRRWPPAWRGSWPSCSSD
ncbi:MAG: hypothetical protein AVDCRST_MAG55-222, partial [uncultured Rubrobacteraceae bacterium]